jgi:hypothetical protein
MRFSSSAPGSSGQGAQLGGELDLRAREDDDATVVLELGRQIEELAHHRRLAKVALQILHQEHGLARHGGHRVERPERLLSVVHGVHEPGAA